MTDGANSSFNGAVGDQLHPPPSPSGIEAYFYYPDESSGPYVDYTKLHVSYLGVDYPANWTLKVHPSTSVFSPNANGTVVMEWNTIDVDTISSNYTVTLVAPDATEIDMRSYGAYSFSADEDSYYTFVIVVDETDGH